MEILDFTEHLWDKTLIEMIDVDEDIWFCSYSYGEPWSNPKSQLKPTRARVGWKNTAKADHLELRDALLRLRPRGNFPGWGDEFPWVKAYLKSGTLSNKLLVTKDAHAFTTEKECRDYHNALLRQALADLDKYEAKMQLKAVTATAEISNLIEENRNSGGLE